MAETITIQGNVGTEPQRIVTANGLTITKFRVGCTHRVFDESTKQWTDKYTNWYNVSAFRNLAEHAFESVKLGDSVIVTGRLIHSTWEVNGRSGTSLDLDADTIGHDLRWGTAQWARRNRSKNDGDGRRQEPDAAEQSSADDTAEDRWAPPSPELVRAGE